jgi:cobalamin biosynthetic protein CobC
LTEHASSQPLFDHLGGCGIMVRRFDYDASRLRWGLPRSESDWARLAAALTSFRGWS